MFSFVICELNRECSQTSLLSVILSTNKLRAHHCWIEGILNCTKYIGFESCNVEMEGKWSFESAFDEPS